MGKKLSALLGVTSSIACYKACSLTNILMKNNMEVKVVLTKNTELFIKSCVFEALSGNPVYVDMFAERALDAAIQHISLAKWCDFLVIAPATANIIGKIANGIADDLLSTTAMSLSAEKPIFIAPAMNTNMWNSPAVTRNINVLSSTKVKAGNKSINKYYIIPPKEGRLACGEYSVGALAKIEDIFKAITEVMYNK
ncbi:MAG: phosphopantothenoylcysteine decarboxylase [Candidatus Omnitrophica bacterium]|nr:phosphopantothenoylcysteine decarboxylase [Candidatus Omnitrophota bacterium]